MALVIPATSVLVSIPADIQCCTKGGAPPPPPRSPSTSPSPPSPPQGCGVPRVNAATLDLIKNAEASGTCDATPQDDTNGIRTIGYGHTCKDDSCSDVPYPIPLSQANCDKLLQDDLVKYETPTANAFANNIRLTDNQYDALVDFIYNLGPGKTSGPVFTRINAGEDVNTVIGQELPKYTKDSSGETQPGLVKKRDDEVALARTASSVYPYKPCSAKVKLGRFGNWERGGAVVDVRWSDLQQR